MIISSAQQIARIIKEGREAKNLTQEILAEEISVSDRAVRMWESGEQMPSIKNKEHLAHFLGIQREALGLQPKTDYSSQDTKLLFKNAALSFDNGAFMSAFTTGDLLVRNLTRQTAGQTVDKDTDLHAALSGAHYLSGHAISILRNDPDQALISFKEMGRLARQIDHKTHQCIALTYQGEMYRRMRNPDKAISTIKKALQIPDVDAQVRGNAQQLLARSYMDKGDRFRSYTMSAMAEAEALAFGGERHTSGLYLCFNPCSVYLDYAKMYMKLGDIAHSFEYITKAENLESLGNIAPRWSISITLNKGEILMHTVTTKVRDAKSILHDPDYLTGAALIEKGYSLAKEFGHRRQAENAQKLASKFVRRGKGIIEVGYDLTERLSQLDKKLEV